jgi:hypothetical protein
VPATERHIFQDIFRFFAVATNRTNETNKAGSMSHQSVYFALDIYGLSTVDLVQISLDEILQTLLTFFTEQVTLMRRLTLPLQLVFPGPVVYVMLRHIFIY